jgi:hypothetical protein
MGNKLDLTGQRFHRLVAISEDPIRSLAGRIRWICQCDCGRTTSVTSGCLREGTSKSCGCLNIESARQRGFDNRTHGMTGTSEYKSWLKMRERCCDKYSINYCNYGGRGITVCDQWVNSFEVFYRDMGPKPGSEYSIERRDNDGNYEPGNCYWATPTEQGNNKRNNVFYNYQGEQLTSAEISRRTGIDRVTLETRINSMGLSMEEAVEYDSGRVSRDSITFNGMTKSLKEWSEYLNIPYSTLHKRLHKLSWSIEKAFMR